VSTIEINIKGHMPEPLSTKVVKSGLWVFALRILNRGLGFIRTIILARLLAPEDFGILGIAMLSISTLETFSHTGFHTTLIQKKDNIESYLNTAWTVSALRGTMLFVLLFFSAPIIARFFNSSAATPVIRVIALFTLFSGLQNISILFFQKELEFHKQFIYEFAATLANLIVAIPLAFLLRNVWALVWGGLASSLVKLILSYALHPYRPLIQLNKQKLKELWHFGKWVLGSTILVFLVTQGDDIFVGKVLSLTALGLYQLSYTLSNLPATEITHVVSRVTFPAYSKLQDDLPRVRSAYLKVLQFISFLSFPLAGAIFIFLPDFVSIFLGDKWTPMVPAAQVLVMAGLLRSIAATTGPIFHALGKPKIDTNWQIIRFLVLLTLIYPLTLQWNILGTSIAVFISILAATIGFTAKTIKLIKFDVSSLVRPICLPLVKTTLAALPIFMFLRSASFVNWWYFVLLLGLYLALYLFLTYLADRFLNYGLSKIIKEILCY
jgi:O-antigen/teichoic acid export membrane protein